MFSTVRTYRVAAGSMDELMHKVDVDFADSLAREEGFIGYQCLALDDTTLVTVSTFRTREQCEESTRMAGDWIRSELADYDIERLNAQTGEVMVSRAQAELLEPAHH